VIYELKGEVVLNQLDNIDNSFVEIFSKREHDGPVLCVESVYDSSRALSGSDDAKSHFKIHKHV